MTPWASDAPSGGIMLARGMAKRVETEPRERLTTLLRTLSHPMVRRVFEVIAEYGPLSTSELAERIDTDVATLLAHTNTLQTAGLISFLRPKEENGRLRVYKAVEEGCLPLLDWVERTKSFRYSER